MTYAKDPVTCSKALSLVRAVADAIREVKEVPSGHLYAQLMSHMDLHAYEQLLGFLERAGLIEVKNNVIKWIEPQIKEQK